MLSICPKCKKQIEHEDFLFEVACECGTRFNPFMGLTEVPPLDGVEPGADPLGGALGGALGAAAPEPPAWQDAGVVDLTADEPEIPPAPEPPPPARVAAPAPAPSAPTSRPIPKPPAAPTPVAPSAPADPAAFEESQAVFDELKEFAEGTSAGTTPRKRAKPLSPPTSASDAVLTAGDGLPGYRIDAYLPPVSAVSALAVDDPNPLRGGFDALWSQATSNGANGVVAMRWVLSPDGNRVILSGTPVRCTKEGA